MPALSPSLHAIAALSLLAPFAMAEVSVPAVFSDHVVLQRDQPLAVWGWGAPGEAVAVRLGGQPAVNATTAADGTWRVTLPKQQAGGPFILAIKGSNEIRIEDVLVGEVWLCSGQSNMEFVVNSVNDAEREKAAATDPQIRQLLVPRLPASQPEPRITAAWTVGSPDTVGGFTAVGYFMARELKKELGVPVGLINASWGGTRIEPWTTADGFSGIEALKPIQQQLRLLDPANPDYRKKLSDHVAAVEEWSKAARANLDANRAVPPAPVLPAELQPLASRPDPQQQPTTLYNGMIHALVGYGMRGAIWYQGESNHGEGALYTEKMKALIGSWRKAWGIGDFPFNFVQIAPYQYNEDLSVLPRFWVAQSAALAIPNTGMVVTNDIGTLADIHPRNKQDVGRRLALIALARTYGKAGTVCEGPVFSAMAVEGAKLRVRFANAAGLASRDGKPLSWFEIVGEDGESAAADAAIDGDSVLLSSPQVAKPVAMRFAWNRDAQPNLVNGAGLPTAAFKAGEVPYADPLAKVPEAKDYQQVYAIDLAKLAKEIVYDSDTSAAVSKPFDRVAYLLELQAAGRGSDYVWVSLDAFTKDPRRIAIPALAADASFQQRVANLVVVSNVKGLTTGPIAEGNIEFWPNNYAPPNGGKVPGASDAVFDFGDTQGEPRDGYGSMQIHNFAAKQTILAINHWTAAGGADLGIGNNAGDNKDWTFAGNAGSYVQKKLRVFVHLAK